MVMTEQKIKEVKKKLHDGEPEGEIKELLRKENYPEAEINKAFTPHQYDMRSWYLIFGVLLSLIGLYAFLMHGNLIILICSAGLLYAFYTEKKVSKNKLLSSHHVFPRITDSRNIDEPTPGSLYNFKKNPKGL